MMRFTAGVLVLCVLGAGADKRPPHGHVEDESVAIEATILTPEQIRDAVGSAFGEVYTVLDVRISPKGDKPYEIHPDDFILRSEATGEHTGPMLAGQIASPGVVVVQRKYAPRSNPEMPQMLESMKVETKDHEGNAGNFLEMVKKRIMTDQTVTAPQSGLMFFPIEKPKPHSLVLSCTTPAGKLRMQFK